MYLLFLALYTISIHNKGKEYILEENRANNLINAVFDQLQKDKSYFYYDLYNLSEIYVEELYCPYLAFIRVEGLKDILNNIYVNLNKFMEKEKKNNIRNKNRI